MAGGRGIERFPSPTAPARLQPKTRQGRHEIELAGPGVALHHRIELDAPTGQGDVTLLDGLLRGVVTQNAEPYRIFVDRLGLNLLGIG